MTSEVLPGDHLFVFGCGSRRPTKGSGSTSLQNRELSMPNSKNRSKTTKFSHVKSISLARTERCKYNLMFTLKVKNDHRSKFSNLSK